MSKISVSGTSVLLLLVLVFQSSVLPDTLGLKSTGRALNAIILAAFAVLALAALFHAKIRKSSLYVVIPSGLVLVGYSINALRSVTTETLGFAGALLPWLAVISVPFMKSFDLARSWLFFFRFMLICALVSLVEYAAVFAGALTPTLIETTRGDFAKGVVTIFHVLEDGSVYDRMYGVFAEPGTFAMLLMPAIAYALVFSKRLALVVFLSCLFLTRSLGGFASLVVLLTMFVYWRTRRLSAQLLLSSSFVLTVAYFFGNFFLAAYESHNLSSTVREENVFLFYENFWHILWEYPFGIPLVGTSLTSLQGNVLYLGSNFAPYTAFVIGGVVALVGYSAVLLVSLIATVRYFAKNNPSEIMACAFISLPALQLFVFQRQTIFDLALFAFLFVSPIMMVFQKVRAAE